MNNGARHGEKFGKATEDDRLIDKTPDRAALARIRRWYVTQATSHTHNLVGCAFALLP